MKLKNPIHAPRQDKVSNRLCKATGGKLRKRHPKDTGVFAGSAVAGLAFTLMTGSANGQSAFSGTWQNFTIISAAGVTNTGPTIVFGNIGLHPLPSITGFLPGVVVNGTVFGPSPVTVLAQWDSRATWVELMNTSSNGDLSGTDLGNFVAGGISPALVPGVYTFTSSA